MSRINVFGSFQALASTLADCPTEHSSLGPLDSHYGRGFESLGFLYGANFFIWLVVLNRCWTSDRLLKQRLPHRVACPLCDQAPETINHLLILCVVARDVWFTIFQKNGLQALSPQPDVVTLIK